MTHKKTSTAGSGTRTVAPRSAAEPSTVFAMRIVAMVAEPMVVAGSINERITDTVGDRRVTVVVIALSPVL